MNENIEISEHSQHKNHGNEKILHFETLCESKSGIAAYDYAGFKFFSCQADKSPGCPGSWKNSENHITLDQAIRAQEQDRMIGAWIPEDVIVIDLDRHEGKPDGAIEFDRILFQRRIKLSRTLKVKTAGNGFHLFYSAPRHTFRQGPKAPGIDLKTHSGYVIAAGSPGYSVQEPAPIAALPLALGAWLKDCETPRAGGPVKTFSKPRTAPTLDMMTRAMLRQGYTWQAGTRNHCACRLGLWAAKSGINPGEVVAWIMQHHGARDFPESEIRKTINSAYRTAQRRDRQ